MTLELEGLDLNSICESSCNWITSEVVCGIGFQKLFVCKNKFSRGFLQKRKMLEVFSFTE